MDNKKCEDCIWFDKCGGLATCEWFDSGVLTEQAEESIQFYEDDFAFRTQLYINQVEEQNS